MVPLLGGARSGQKQKKHKQELEKVDKDYRASLVMTIQVRQIVEGT